MKRIFPSRIGSPHAPVHIGERAYTYDANGNQTGWTHDVSGQQRELVWDEENRIASIADNGALYSYIYDASGERVMKNNGQGQTISIDGSQTGNGGKIGNYTIYVNPYVVVRSGQFTKHFYIESQRVVTKLGEDGLEQFQYYYHPDHLGSSAYITDVEGEVTQHIEYFPFGETFLEEHSNTDRTPYLFNGKELDEETGLYYYGARYYDVRTSVWQSVDPLALYDPVKEVEHYLDGEHNAGVFNSGNLSVYGYTYQNPLRYIDPNGKQVDITISNRAAGSTQLRLIGSEYYNGAPATVTVPTYVMTVTDKATGTISLYEVTRESLVATGIDYDTFSSNEYYAENRAFEPRNDSGHYKAVALNYPEGTNLEALALRNSNDSGKLETDSKRPGENKGSATGIMIHVGGRYEKNGKSHTVGSLGCFGLAGSNEGNKGVKDFIKDVVSRQSSLKKAGMNSSINVTIEKRKNVDWNWVVDKEGKKQSWNY